MKIRKYIFYKYRFNLPLVLTDYLTLYYVFKRTDCMYWKFIEWYLFSEEIMRKLIKISWNKYKRRRESIATLLFKELMYLHRLLEELKLDNGVEDVVWTYAVYDFSLNAKHHYMSLIPRGACPLCPILRKESCDRTPSWYFKQYVKGHEQEIVDTWKILWKKQVWLQIVDNDIIARIRNMVERMTWLENICKKYNDWECTVYKTLVKTPTGTKYQYGIRTRSE